MLPRRYHAAPPGTDVLHPGALLTPDLPERLRAQTRDLHLLSERSGVMAQLIAGQLALPGYVALVRNLHALYGALEGALERHRGDAAIQALGLAALRREPALAADMAVLAGPHWPSLPLAAATQAYVQRLARIGNGDAPLPLVAHAYVRYLGDLHGGQLIKRLLGRSPMLAQASAGASAFYEFGSAAQVQVLQRALRSGLAQTGASAEQADVLVAEARWAFQQHVTLFEQLVDPQDPAPVQAQSRPLV